MSVHNGQLWRNGRAYRFAGANLWYAAQLGSTPDGRQRLTRELDRLHAAGLTHVRIMAASEGRPDATVPRPCEKWCNPTHGHCSWDKYPVNCACSGCGFCRSQAPELLDPKRLDAACRQGGSAQMEPPMQPRPGQYDDAVLHGLDFALAMLLKRGMTATLCLNNMWQWSGGFAVYVAWATGQAPPIMRIDAKDQDWQAHQEFASRFYEVKKARELSYNHMRVLTRRKNLATGTWYRDDPAIMAWQLANEPRALSRQRAYREWIGEAIAVLRREDCAHLVTVGSEGPSPWPSYVNNDLEADHQHADFMTIHVWPQNWNWYNPAKPDLKKAWDKSVKYITAAVEAAHRKGKPLVIEEFGLARDGGDLSAGAATTERDDFVRRMCEHAAGKREVAGVAVWAWGGEGRPKQREMARGDAWIGDPPHEPQGWYSVYDADAATIAALAECARVMQ